MLFPDFALTQIEVPGGTIWLRKGGSGPPLLLHGNRQTHMIWHRTPRIGPALWCLLGFGDTRAFAFEDATCRMGDEVVA